MSIIHEALKQLENAPPGEVAAPAHSGRSRIFRIGRGWQTALLAGMVLLGTAWMIHHVFHGHEPLQRNAVNAPMADATLPGAGETGQGKPLRRMATNNMLRERMPGAGAERPVSSRAGMIPRSRMVEAHPDSSGHGRKSFVQPKEAVSSSGASGSVATTHKPTVLRKARRASRIRPAVHAGSAGNTAPRAFRHTSRPGRAGQAMSGGAKGANGTDRIRTLIAGLRRAMKMERQEEVADGLVRLERMAGPDSLLTLQMRAYWEMQRGNDVQARRILERMLLVRPDDLWAGVNLAILEARGGKMESAVRRLKELRVRHPESQLPQRYLDMLGVGG